MRERKYSPPTTAMSDAELQAELQHHSPERRNAATSELKRRRRVAADQLKAQERR